MTNIQKKYYFLKNQLKNIENSIINFLSHREELNLKDKEIIDSLELTKLLITNQIKSLVNPHLNIKPKINRISDFLPFKKICVDSLNKLNNNYPKIDKTSNKKSLIIETRVLPETEFIIKNTIQKLGDGWGHIVVCHEDNHNQIEKICSTISDQIEIKKIDSKLNRNTYNNLCLDINFWETINCEKVLVYQTDTFIFKNFDEKFLEYDWIGGVWSDIHVKHIQQKLGWQDLWGCNGGLNLRTVSVIKEILKTQPLVKDIFGGTDYLPEDTFFSWHIKNNYKLPPKEICEEFSNDKKFELNIFGTHQPWNGNMENFIKFVNNLYGINE
jgi:hypothetical protein